MHHSRSGQACCCGAWTLVSVTRLRPRDSGQLVLKLSQHFILQQPATHGAPNVPALKSAEFLCRSTRAWQTSGEPPWPWVAWAKTWPPRRQRRRLQPRLRGGAAWPRRKLPRGPPPPARGGRPRHPRRLSPLLALAPSPLLAPTPSLPLAQTPSPLSSRQPELAPQQVARLSQAHPPQPCLPVATPAAYERSCGQWQSCAPLELCAKMCRWSRRQPHAHPPLLLAHRWWLQQLPGPDAAPSSDWGAQLSCLPAQEQPLQRPLTAYLTGRLRDESGPRLGQRRECCSEQSSRLQVVLRSNAPWPLRAPAAPRVRSWLSRGAPRHSRTHLPNEPPWS